MASTKSRKRVSPSKSVSGSGSFLRVSDTEGIKSIRREALIRQPSYCKILDDLQGTEERVANLKTERPSHPDLLESSANMSQLQTITINGQQYQILSPGAEALGGLPISNEENGQTLFIPGVSGGTPVDLARNTSSPSDDSPSGSVDAMRPRSSEENSRKREIRLLKNREAARECRNKKKEYIKCLENRVAVLENQNKALIEELKSLKELYTGQKS